ncbi:MAG: methyltransferase domain-containing protein, partial [Oscillospiraceae bacterium]|nr:methyltransferase domain-containing protein [Oscillospiraceae bacterium]
MNQQLSEQMHGYWQGRAQGYSEYNQMELRDSRALNWSLCLQEYIHRFAPDCPHDQIKILDVGTGPGFFAILLKQAGYDVTACDFTLEMLEQAKGNAG